MHDDLRSAITDSVATAAEEARDRIIAQTHRKHREARFTVMAYRSGASAETVGHLTFEPSCPPQGFRARIAACLLGALESLDTEEPEAIHEIQAGTTPDSRDVCADISLHAGTMRRVLVRAIDHVSGSRHIVWPAEIGSRYTHLKESPDIDAAIRRALEPIKAGHPFDVDDVIRVYADIADAFRHHDSGLTGPAGELEAGLHRILADRLIDVGTSVAPIVMRDTMIAADVERMRRGDMAAGRTPADFENQSAGAV